jgi:hypothetical protein
MSATTTAAQDQLAAQHRQAARNNQTYTDLAAKRLKGHGLTLTDGAYQQSAEGVLNNLLYRAVRDANAAHMAGTDWIESYDAPRPGLLAGVVIARLYNGVDEVLRQQKQYNGQPMKIAELQKLLDLLAPLAASLDPRQESIESTLRETEYQAKLRSED